MCVGMYVYIYIYMHPNNKQTPRLCFFNFLPAVHHQVLTKQHRSTSIIRSMTGAITCCVATRCRIAVSIRLHAFRVFLTSLIGFISLPFSVCLYACLMFVTLCFMAE